MQSVAFQIVSITELFYKYYASSEKSSSSYFAFAISMPFSSLELSASSSAATIGIGACLSTVEGAIKAVERARSLVSSHSLPLSLFLTGV